ncbi:MAG: GNAT family N-acetyltransferase [Spirochaetales bacterium]|nr:GNAT family N-acetyltransferase [Spirochaetales bacterium]
MKEKTAQHNAIKQLTQEYQERIKKNPLLNIDTFIIPSPYIRDVHIQLDYGHSYVWVEEGEILGYILVYSDQDHMKFHIYKLVTHPFGRGRGIGNAFIQFLAQQIAPQALIYLYLWEKQPDTLEFFRSKGFSLEESIVYRNRIYYLMTASPAVIIETSEAQQGVRDIRQEDIAKTRHDAKKTVRLLSSMVNSITNENSGRIIEDINRETTTLLNILNIYRDASNPVHEVNIKDLIFDRIIPYIEASSVPCKISFSMDVSSPNVLGYFVNYGRALINLAANALEAIHESKRHGEISISLKETDDYIVLFFFDNGSGIPEELLEEGEGGIPKFVGKTTKDRMAGEGLGTVQIFSTFDPRNIEVRSDLKKGTEWVIRMDKVPKGIDRWYTQLERRFNEFQDLIELHDITGSVSRNEVISYIWQMRKMELFLFDLILQFSNDHNIRDIYRMILSYCMDYIPEKELHMKILGLKCRKPRLRSWLYTMTVKIKQQKDMLKERVDIRNFQGPLFRSYGQAMDNVIIFTMDPENGRFFATDRKLAEHLDFVSYLGKDRDHLLRGELVGDVNNYSQPITLGVWTVTSDEDLMRKLRLIRRGAQALLYKGLHTKKKLSFYQTTYVRHDKDIHSDMVTTCGEMAAFSDDYLKRFITASNDELDGFLTGVE